MKIARHTLEYTKGVQKRQDLKIRFIAVLDAIPSEKIAQCSSFHIELHLNEKKDSVPFYINDSND